MSLKKSCPLPSCSELVSASHLRFENWFSSQDSRGGYTLRSPLLLVQFLLFVSFMVSGVVRLTCSLRMKEEENLERPWIIGLTAHYCLIQRNSQGNWSLLVCRVLKEELLIIDQWFWHSQQAESGPWITKLVATASHFWISNKIQEYSNFHENWLKKEE